MKFDGTGTEVSENVPLAPLTTLGVGGAARFFAEVRDESEIAPAMRLAAARGLRVFVLGGGSNVVVSDSGFDGLVLRIAIPGVVRDGPLVTAGAGEDWDAFVARCAAWNLAGVECLSGIPGLVGGTPIQNVGAYGQEVSETIVRVRAFDRAGGGFVELSRTECGFGYRSSIFNTTERGRYIVVAVTFLLEPGGAPKIVYRDLRAEFGDRVPTLAETRDAVCRIRRSKGMLVRQGGADARSAGSFFKNPLVVESDLLRISGIADRLGLGRVPVFPGDAGFAKVPAAWLIEQAGFAKGYRSGRAGLSTLHTLALTNRGGATAAEIIALKNEIQARVAEVFGVELVPEPVFVE